MTGTRASRTSSASNTPIARRRPQWVRAAQFTGQMQVYLACFAFVIYPLGVAIVLAIVANNVDQITQSGISGGQHAAIWFPFSVSIMMVASYLTPHVASGMTRRSFIIGNVVVALGTALVYALYLTAALGVERWIYHRLGWLHNVSTADGVAVFSNGVLPTFLTSLMLIASGTVAGLLVSACYYRFGGLLGTLLLPIGLAPIFAVGVLGLDRDVQFTPFGWNADIGAAGPFIGIAAIAAAAVLFGLIVRRTEISGVDE